MTVAILFLDKALPAIDDEVKLVNQNFFVLIEMVVGLTKAIASNAEDYHVPADIVEALKDQTLQYSIGTNRVSEVTSEWAKKTYPNARYEMVLSLVEEGGKGRSHVLILYIP